LENVFDDIRLRGDAAVQLSAQSLTDIVVIDEDEFNKQVTERETYQQKTKPGLLPTK